MLDIDGDVFLENGNYYNSCCSGGCFDALCSSVGAMFFS